MPVRSGYDAEHRKGPRSQSQEDRLRGQAGPPPRLLLGLPAAHLPRRRQGQERDRGQPVVAAGPRRRPDRRRAEGPAAGPGRRGGRHHPVGAARPCRRRARDGPEAGAARAAGARARDPARARARSRVIAPASKLSTLAWWDDTTLGADLGVAGASTDDIYAAMDWLVRRQDAIEAGLAARHLAPEANPARMALFDLSSSWLEGRCCPLAARGYSRDGKKGKLQVEYGLLTDPEGRPVAVRVLPGNTGDPAAFTGIVKVIRDKFKLEKMVMVGDRGMITSARIEALNTAADGTPLAGADAYSWITALRAPAIRKLLADDGPLQLSLFDQQNLAEVTHPDYPGERLVACRNPALAADRARTRSELPAATEKLLAPLIARVAAGRLTGAGAIGVEVGKVISKYKTAKHFTIEITGTSLAITRNQAQIEEEAALDGFYVLRTPVPASQLDAAGVVSAYKNLSRVERGKPDCCHKRVRSSSPGFPSVSGLVLAS